MRVLLLCLLMFSCARATPAEEELVVFAASSLRDVFGELSKDFQRERHARVTFNFAGSQELRTQLEHGAQADVFASADEVPMQALVDAGQVTDVRRLARNELVLIVAREERERVTSLDALPEMERLVMGGPSVPVGRYARLALAKAADAGLGEDFAARVERRVVSNELSVRQVLARVSLGEAQAGFVYRSDALTAADAGIGVVELPEAMRVVATYQQGIVVGSRHSALARQWVALTLSERGRSALSASGFLPP